MLANGVQAAYFIAIGYDFPAHLPNCLWFLNETSLKQSLLVVFYLT